ncbi:MAG: PfkB family carbohydrate kinase [Bacteroidota bacterium]|nr:PfkB family carbohydrate kinase [Bacteroidota bacterium]
MHRVLAFGEILFDSFPDHEVLGGAPFNFISHIHQFSTIFNLPIEPIFVSRIGIDERGQLIKNYFKKINFPCTYLQESEKQYTGVVLVSVDSKGQAQYEILENAAWDFIDLSKNLKTLLSKGVSMFYFGSLIQRTSHNRNILNKCLPDDDVVAEKVLFDINIRQGYHSWDVIESSLISCDILKVNHEELELLRNKYFKNEKFTDEFDFIFYLMSNYHLDQVVMTMAEKGARIITSKHEVYEQKAKPLDNKIDTVGAGDAFAAVYAIGNILGWPPRTILERSLSFSANICQINGAIPKDNSIYREYKMWFE